MMRKLALLLLFFCISSPAWATNFVELDRDDRYLIYIDTDSIAQRTTYNQEYLVAWIKWIPRGEALKEQLKIYKTSSIDYFMQFYAFNRNLKQMQTLSIIVYDKKGNAIYSNSWQFSPSRYDEVIPRTYGAFFYDAVMFSYE